MVKKGVLEGVRARNGAVALLGVLILLPAVPASITARAASLTATYEGTLGGPGHAAMYPSGLEVAPNGDIIVADTGNDQIAEYTTSGTLVWRVGSEGTGTNPVQFEQPRDVGVDTAGDVFVADNANGRVVELDGSTGAYITSWKSVPGSTGAPIGITVSDTTASLPNLPAGERVYVADGNKSEVTVFNTSGTYLSTITSAGACKLNRMRDAAADAAGNVFVANYENDNILEFSWSGSAWQCVTSWGTKGTVKGGTGVCSGNGDGAFQNPYGVAVGTDPYIDAGSPGEAIYVADSNDDCIQEFTPAGSFVAEMGGPGDDTEGGTFTQLRRVAVDADGNVWGADLWGYRVEEFLRTPTGYTYNTTIPDPIVQPGNTDTSVYNQVRGIDFDSAGDIVSMDTVNQRVVVMNPAGHILYMCGQRGFTSVGDFNWPRGVAVDQANNNIWIADTKQSDIQILNNSSTCGAVAEFGVQGAALDDLNYPYSIAINHTDNIAWVADTRNDRVVSYNVATQTPIAGYGSLGSGAGQMSSPSGIGIDQANGNILVADTNNKRIVELSDSGGSSITQVATFTTAGGSAFNHPYGVAGNAAGDIAIADSNNNRVVVLNPDGSLGTVITGSDVTGGGPTSLLNPENVAFGPNGDLYIADTYNDRILVYSLSTNTGPDYLVAPTYASTLLGPGVASMYPVDASSSSQYYFILDAGNYRVVAVNRTTHNQDCTVGGFQGSGPGQFGDARALWFDNADNELFVADTPNNRVEVFSFSASACATGSTTAFQFLFQFGSTGNGNGEFNNAYGVAVDTVNQWVYVTDGSGWVDKFDLSGNYIGQFGKGIVNEPRQVSVAPNSDVFVMDARNHRVDVFNSSGTLLFSFGGLGTGNGQFTDDPRGIDISSDGTMAFATDSGGNRVEVFNLAMTSGHYSSATFDYTIPTGTGNGAFVGPRGITVTADNHILLTDEWGFNLHEFSFTPGTTSNTDTWDSTPAPPPVPGVDTPRGVHVAPDGQIYVVDYWNQRIEYVNPNGSGATAFGFRGTRIQKGALNFAWDAAIQPSTGDVFVANRESDQVEVFSGTGTYITTWGTRGSADGDFLFPQGIAFAPDGTLYVSDSSNGRIEQFSIGSNSVGTWMANYGQPGKASQGPGYLNQATGIAFAPDGTLWVADTLNKSIQKMSTAGVWTRYTAPIASVTQKPFNVPWGVTVAPDGSIWVSSTGNNAIISIDSNDNLIFDATGATIGVPPLNGTQTIYPFTLAFDSSDNVYVSDVWNNRVLALTTHLAS